MFICKYMVNFAPYTRKFICKYTVKCLYVNIWSTLHLMHVSLYVNIWSNVGARACLRIVFFVCVVGHILYLFGVCICIYTWVGATFMIVSGGTCIHAKTVCDFLHSFSWFWFVSCVRVYVYVYMYVYLYRFLASCNTHILSYIQHCKATEYHTKKVLVCMYVWMCVCVYVCMSVCMYVSHMNTHTQTYSIHTYIHTYFFVYLPTHPPTHSPSHTHTHTHTHAHTVFSGRRISYEETYGPLIAKIFRAPKTQQNHNSNEMGEKTTAGDYKALPSDEEHGELQNGKDKEGISSWWVLWSDHGHGHSMPRKIEFMN
jgi:hypothetical protein